MRYCLLPLLLLSACSTTVEEIATQIPSVCDHIPIQNAERVAIKFIDNKSVIITPDPGLATASISTQIDLNNDGLSDLILRFADACGNWGECPYGIYIRCNENQYIAASDINYMIGLEVSESNKTEGHWRDLTVITRKSDTQTSRAILRFNDGRYRLLGESN